MTDQRMRAAIIKALGGHCTARGFADIRALRIVRLPGCDVPVNGRNWAAYWTRVLAHATAGGVGFRVECANCYAIQKSASAVADGAAG